MGKILDICCGSRMFHFDRENEDVIFMDNRVLSDTLCDGRKLTIRPGVVGDFRNTPFKDNEFDMVIFDPPHLIHAGEQSWLAKKYGVLNSETWQDDLRAGFNECFRVLRVGGTLVFKWSETQIKLAEIMKLTEYKPIVGNKRSNTHWLIFYKGAQNERI